MAPGMGSPQGSRLLLAKGRASSWAELSRVCLCAPRWQRGDWDGLEHLTEVRHDCTTAWESEEEANLVCGRGESVPVQ